MGGKLTKAAAEFWFPECRNCECCTGYKHGCKCCVGDVTQCSCLNSNVSTDAKDITSTNTSNTQVDDVAASNVTQVEGTLSMKDETPS